MNVTVPFCTRFPTALALGVVCWIGGCNERAALSTLGGECEDESDCVAGLKCYLHHCSTQVVPPDDAFEHRSQGSVDLVWVPIAGGTSEMGCSGEDDGCLENERPAHTVTLSPFEMLEAEVTEGQFFETMGWNNSSRDNRSDGADTPMESVTHNDASEFCIAIGGRLPSEAEWEFAARGGATSRYVCGNDPQCLDDVAWYEGNSGGTKQRVRAKSPNAYGLYDMLGNVQEWTQDWFDPEYYAASPDKDPLGPAKTGPDKVVRGGSFKDGAALLRVTSRQSKDSFDDYGWEHVGFRCVRKAGEN